MYKVFLVVGELSRWYHVVDQLCFVVSLATLVYCWYHACCCICLATDRDVSCSCDIAKLPSYWADQRIYIYTHACQNGNCGCVLEVILTRLLESFLLLIAVYLPIFPAPRVSGEIMMTL